MKKLLNKKNNKGFSLVELIVVVLIMGIIAVALAPQVMKWVGTARTNSDENTKKDLKNAVQIALTDWQQKDSIPSSGNLFYDVDASGITVQTGSTDWGSTGHKLIDTIKEVTGGDFSKPQGGTKYVIKIEAPSGKVTVGIDSVPST